MAFQTIKAELLRREITEAIEDDEPDIIEELISNKKPDLNNLGDDTAVGIALYNGKINLLQTLISSRASVDKPCPIMEGCSPLWYAIINDLDEAVKVLVKNHADVNKEFLDLTPFGDTPEHRIEELVKKDVPSLLEEKKLDRKKLYKHSGATLTPLIYSLSNHNKNNISAHLLSSDKLDIDKKCAAGVTALDMAIRKGHHNFVEQILVQFKASHKIKSFEVSPIARAARERQDGILKLLKRYSSSVKTKNNSETNSQDTSQSAASSSSEAKRQNHSSSKANAGSKAPQTKRGNFSGGKTHGKARSGNNSIKILSNKIREALGDLAASTIDYCEAIDPEFTRKVTNIVRYFLEGNKSG